MYLKVIVFVIAFLGINACGGSSSSNTQEELTLKVHQVFQGEIPEEYKSCDNQEMSDKYGRFTVYLGLPERISFREPLLIDIYGCWITEHFVGRDAFYKGLEVLSQDRNRVDIRLKMLDNTNGEVPALYEQFRKWHTFAINGDWSPRELNVVVHNPDNQELNVTVVVGY